ncbi:MAG: hypothetical protein HKM95_09290 [Inquilinus sp.]|nr:hypothetical protein [Inquilinus sp.]
MASKSKSRPAALTGSLLAPKGMAGPAAVQQAPTIVEIAKVEWPQAKADDIAVPINGTGGFQVPVRLDPAAYVELRLAAARAGKTCEEIIQAALLQYLAETVVETETAGPQARSE